MRSCIFNLHAGNRIGQQNAHVLAFECVQYIQHVTDVKADFHICAVISECQQGIRSVVERESGKAVLVVHNGRAEVQPITVQREVATDVFVSAGLTGAETIIVGEQLSQLQIGDRVEVKPQ